MCQQGPFAHLWVVDVLATIEPNWKSNCVYRPNNVALMRIVVYGHELLPIAARITSYHITACVVD